MQSDMLEKCIAISQSHFLYVPYKDLTIDQIYGVDEEIDRKFRGGV